MRAGLLIMPLIGFGCAGPEVSRTHDVAESHLDTCPSSLVPYERDRAVEGRCLVPSVGWGPAGEALSGVATAMRIFHR